MKLNLINSSDPLVKRVTLAHVLLLGLTILLETVVFAVQWSPKTAAPYGACLAVLAVLSATSIYWPVGRGRWYRLAVCFLELALVGAASAFGIYRWIWPLYLTLVARAALISDEDDLPKIVVGSCALQFAWYFVHTMQMVPANVWSQMISTAALSGLMMTASTSILVLVVAVGMRSLISEQKLRKEAERLAWENEVLATELERTRIAREIHYTLGHSLTALKLQLELASRMLDIGDTKARDAVSQAEQLAARSLTDTRVALQSIRNSDFDFEKALEDLLHELRTTALFEVTLDCANLPKLSNAIGYQLYRVIQECTTNTLKHAQASALEVSLSADTAQVSLDVKDDGVGFDATNKADGFGLKGIRERIASLRGEVTVRSGKGAGTTISVKVPL
jgi:signal transduction histidine kinase